MLFDFFSYESILSQLRRHTDNPIKLHNDESYYEFSSLEELLLHPDQDPFGIKSQFDHFLTDKVSYPIVLVRYESLNNLKSLEKLESLVSKLTGNQYNFTSLYDEGYKRESSLDLITDGILREQFVQRYSDLQQIFESQPLIRLLMPKDDKISTK